MHPSLASGRLAMLRKLSGCQAQMESTGFSYSLSQLIRDESWFQHMSNNPLGFDVGRNPRYLISSSPMRKHFIDNIDIKAPFTKSDHATLEFEFICYWTQWVTKTRYSRNFSKSQPHRPQDVSRSHPGIARRCRRH